METDRSLEHLKEIAMDEIKGVLREMFPHDTNWIPEKYLDLIVSDMHHTAHWMAHGYYTTDDIKAAIEYTIIYTLIKYNDLVKFIQEKISGDVRDWN